tara:strand:+ start:165 stop:833 length:669 start_codon:yes stop_codon:yes gene_type:complete
MKEQDKILINAYLENETNEEETKLVEALIKEDSDASEYFNEVKMLNAQINSLAQEKPFTELSKRNQLFIEREIMPQLDNKGSSIFDFLQSVAFRHIAGYTFTAMLFVGIGSSFVNNQSSIENNDLLGFDNSITITRDFPKFRSQEVDSLESKLESVLDDMLAEQVSNARFTWGADSYFVNINSVTYPYDNLPCYLGEFFDEGVKTEFLYCVSDQSNSLTFNN